ncbi:carbohydrate-binding module family 12 protein [Gautieria morchelliformis]|nr:carbohydrate-binding module family 12 protein [Gautieria morchelliformis]
MVCLWEPGTQYDLGTVVEYQGHRYKIIQPHRSQADWTPPATPALWGKLPEAAGLEACTPEYEQRQKPVEHHSGSFDGEEQPWHEQQSQKVEIHHEEQQKHWYDLDDKRKKQLEIGGGLAAGLAVLGAGYYAFHKHEKSEEQKKAEVWGLQRWIHDAQARAAEFHQHGPKGPVTWLLVNGRNIPPSAILGGEEDGQPIFIARAFLEGGIHVGKAGRQFEQGAVIGYKHKEIQLSTYEVLIGDARGIRWVDTQGHLRPRALGCRLVEGGQNETGSPMYIAQVDHKYGVCPGKASEDLDGASIPYGGGEVHEKAYRVLTYA